MKVLIYQDYVHNNGLLHRALCRHFGTGNIGFCDAEEVTGGALDQQTRLLIMPGGADLYYAEKLDGAGNTAIRRFVENGGTYLGICAGAYYGCSALAWAKGTEQDISGPRALAFFPGTAIGPVHDFIEDGSVEKSWLAAPELIWDDGKERIACKVCYEGGPVFVPDTPGGFTILARYDGDRPAIVECPVGAGKVILCSPHLERAADDAARKLYRHRNTSYDRDCLIIQTMRPDEAQARRLWTALLERCVT